MATPYTNEAAQFIHDNMKGKAPWWEALIDGYLRERDRCAKPYWDLARECYEQEQFTGYPPGDRYTLDQVQPPRVYGLVHQIESQVFNRNPKFFVSPMTPKQEGLAQFAEGALEHRMASRCTTSARNATGSAGLHPCGVGLDPERRRRRP
jgi:hypothetical protein